MTLTKEQKEKWLKEIEKSDLPTYFVTHENVTMPPEMKKQLKETCWNYQTHLAILTVHYKEGQPHPTDTLEPITVCGERSE